MMRRLSAFGLRVLNNHVRKNRLLTRLAFGVRTPDNENIQWDFTTVALKRALGRMVRNKPRFLEIGTGPYAMLAIYLYRRGHRSIVANDINQDYVKSAVETASLNDADIAVVRSDLFSSITEKYDIILFNSVYIPRRLGEELGLDLIHRSDTHWCGGDRGTEVIERFLRNSINYLSRDGAVYLGFNPHYLPEERMQQIITAQNYRVEHRIKTILIPSIVYVLKSYTP